MLSVREVAKRLRVGRAKVLEWIHAGELQAANIGTDARPAGVW